MALEDIQRERIKKLNNIKNLGINPYPATSNRKHLIAEALNMMGKKVTVVGRIRSLRQHGKITFADLEDSSGKIQIFLSQAEIPHNYDFLSNLDLGDFIEVSGEVFKTQAGQISVKASQVTLLTKSIRPLPSSWYGLKDAEERYRKRYLDLLLNPEVKHQFILKSKFWQSVRNFLVKNGFLEIETPMFVKTTPGGARVFKVPSRIHPGKFYSLPDLKKTYRQLLETDYKLKTSQIDSEVLFDLLIAKS